jgi:hypothetical protein
MTTERFTLDPSPRDDAPLLTTLAPTDDSTVRFACPHCSAPLTLDAERWAVVAGFHAMCGDCHRSFTYPITTENR